MTLRAEIRSAPVAAGTFGSPSGSWGTATITVTGTYVGDEDVTFTVTASGTGTVGTTAGISVIVDDGRSETSYYEIDVGDTYTAGTAVKVRDGLAIALAAGTIADAQAQTIAATARWVHPDENLSILLEDSANQVAKVMADGVVSRDPIVRSLDGRAVRVTRPIGRNARWTRVSYLKDAELETLARIVEGRGLLAMYPVWDRNTALMAQFQRSLVNELGPNTALTRATVAGYTDSRDGLQKSVASGAARYEAGKLGDGILLEEARTNYITYSADFTNAAWTKNGSGPAVVTGNQAYGPFGTKTADELEIQTAGDWLSLDSGQTATEGHVWILSGWAWTEEAEFTGSIGLRIKDSSNTAVTGTITPLKRATGDSWTSHFYEALGTIPASPTGNVLAQIVGLSTFTGKVMLEGWQLEKATNNDQKASSHIATSGASVARNMDQALISDLDINAEEGSIMLWWEFSAETRARIFSLNNSANWYLGMQSGNVLRWQYGSGSTVNTDYIEYDLDSLSGGVPSEGDMIQVAVTWDASGEDTALYVNGASVASTSVATGWTNPLPAKDLYLYQGTQAPAGVVQGLRVDSVERTAAEVQEHYDRFNATREREPFRRLQGRRYWVTNTRLSDLPGGQIAKYVGDVQLAEARLATGQRIHAEV